MNLPAIYIINLKYRTDRLKQMEELMKNLNVQNWQRFSAIRPKLNSENSYLYRDYPKHLKINKKYVRGSVGCKLSHLNCIKLAKKNNLESILILEDDVEFTGTTQSLFFGLQEASYLSKDEWKILYLGLNRQKLKKIDDFILVHKVLDGYCTHAYIVNSKYYDYFIKLLENSTKQIDETYHEDFKNGGYFIIPNQFKQNKSYSDISANFLF